MADALEKVKKYVLKVCEIISKFSSLLYYCKMFLMSLLLRF